jgi:N-acetylglucosaminyldiphosphoundecaprenol N-acetyl-beta-D-mannosaminyltransferase
MAYRILGTRVDPVSYDSAVQVICLWVQHRESRFVCAANVHMVMEGHDHLDFRDKVNAADLVTPDGMPLVWVLRRMGSWNQERVYGPELMLRLLTKAEECGIHVGFLGSTPETLAQLVEQIHQRFPNLRIAYTYSPPFGPVMPEEDLEIVREINESGAGILFIGLGCPKQEKWMAAHSGKIQVVMVGVGAAFDFIAGTKRQAPVWMQKSGLEWLYRLGYEPRRLWRRYLYHNSRYVLLVILPLFIKITKRTK